MNLIDKQEQIFSLLRVFCVLEFLSIVLNKKKRSYLFINNIHFSKKNFTKQKNMNLQFEIIALSYCKFELTFSCAI